MTKQFLLQNIKNHFYFSFNLYNIIKGEFMDNEKIKKLLKYTTYVEKFKYHNQIINFLDRFYEKDDFPKTLINFDLHSDMKTESSVSNVLVSNWVNYIFSKYEIDEYYWVIPKHALYDEKFQEIITSTKSKNSGNYTGVPYTDFSKPLKQSFVFRYDNKGIYQEACKHSDEEILDYIDKSDDKYKLIHVYYCTEDNLPDFLNEDVIVSVDADYFSNTGYDTTNNYEHSPENIEQDFEKFIECLENKHIYPTYLGLCSSPNYVKDLENSDKFFDLLIQNHKSPVKFDIEYTYTDLRDDKYKSSKVYFYTIANTIEVFYRDNPNVPEAEIKRKLQNCRDNYENGVYMAKLYSKEIEDSYGNKEVVVYQDDIEIKQIAGEDGDLNTLFNKMKEKIEELSEK